MISKKWNQRSATETWKVPNTRDTSFPVPAQQRIASFWSILWGVGIWLMAWDMVDMVSTRWIWIICKPQTKQWQGPTAFSRVPLFQWGGWNLQPLQVRFDPYRWWQPEIRRESQLIQYGENISTFFAGLKIHVRWENSPDFEKASVQYLQRKICPKLKDLGGWIKNLFCQPVKYLYKPKPSSKGKSLPYRIRRDPRAWQLSPNLLWMTEVFLFRQKMVRVPRALGQLNSNPPVIRGHPAIFYLPRGSSWIYEFIFIGGIFQREFWLKDWK